MTDLPQGFTVHVANMGVKDDTNDLMVLHCETAATTAAGRSPKRLGRDAIAPAAAVARTEAGGSELLGARAATCCLEKSHVSARCAMQLKL